MSPLEGSFQPRKRSPSCAVAKTLTVEFTATALQDLLAIRDYIARDKPAAARRWVEAIIRRAQSLHRFPVRHEVIPEATQLGVGYRHLIQGKYRVIYRVAERKVYVIRVIHGARLLDLESLQ
jgi:addiction module RelE/StbE family toxin